MSSSEAVATVNTEAIEREVAPVVREAEALAVYDVETHTRGLTLLGRVMDARDRVKVLFKPAVEAAMESKRKAEAARQEIVALQDTLLAPVLEAQRQISAKCSAFEAEERRVAALNQAAINSEALARQEAQRLLDAAMADTEEEAEDALTEPLPPPMVPTVKPEVAKVYGVSSRTTWSAEVTDKEAFVRWALESANLFLLEVNLVGLNSRARAERAEMKIPGVRAVESISHARR